MMFVTKHAKYSATHENSQRAAHAKHVFSHYFAWQNLICSAQKNVHIIFPDKLKTSEIFDVFFFFPGCVLLESLCKF